VVLFHAVSALKGAIPLLRLEPLIDIAPAKPPMLAYLGRWDTPVLRQGVEGRLGDLEVAVQLLNRQNVRVCGFHGIRNNNWYQLLLVII